MSVSYGRMTSDLSVSQIEASLSGRFGRPLRYFDEISSTNPEAMAWAMAGAPEGAIVVADHQTGGKGRWGRSWFSLPGRLLQFSLILRPRLAPERHGLLTAALGVASARAVRAVTAVGVEIKWPNDLVVAGKKISGMLVESVLAGPEITVAVCGIGINVGLSADEIPKDLRGRASSLAIEIRGKGREQAPSRSELLARILAEIEVRYVAIGGGNATDLVREARDLSAVIGRGVVIRSADGTTIEGIAEDLDDDAALVVRTVDRSMAVHVGEIEQLRVT